MMVAAPKPGMILETTPVVIAKTMRATEPIMTKRGSVLVFLFNLLYRVVVAAGYFESVLLKNVPGSGGHYTLVKKND